VMHGDIPGARSAKMASAYQADFIMNALEKLHPRFYPRPLIETVRDGKVIAIDDVKDGFLTKDELVKSYRAAGDYLHAGDVTDFLTNRQKIFDPEATSKWVKRLITLLNIHAIYLTDKPNAWEGKDPIKFADGEPAPKIQIIVQMRSETDDKPAASRFETIGEAPWRPEESE
jgi:hypothetical protein